MYYLNNITVLILNGIIKSQNKMLQVIIYNDNVRKTTINIKRHHNDVKNEHGVLSALSVEFPHSHLRQSPCSYSYCLVFLNKDNNLFGKTTAFV